MRSMGQIKYEMYQMRDQEINKMNNQPQLIDSGDFNAHVVIKQQDEIVRRHGEDENTDTGESLIIVCKQSLLKI